MRFQYHFPVQEIGFCGEMADFGQEMSKIILEYLLYQKARVILKSTKDMSEGLRSQLEEFPTGPRWDSLCVCLSIRITATVAIHEFVMIL